MRRWLALTKRSAIYARAVDADWFNAAAHVELGALLTQMHDRHHDSEQQFRQAIAIEPGSVSAAIGLSQARTVAGDDVEAESILRDCARRTSGPEEWRVHLALARALIQRGDKQQSPEIHSQAYSSALEAIAKARDSEADPHFVAGVAQHRMGSSASETAGRIGYRQRARRHLRRCLKRDPTHSDAQLNLQVLDREIKIARPLLLGGYAIGLVSILILAAVWMMFFISDKVTDVMVTVITPVFAGLFTVSVLLPALVRLKLPGFEADLQPWNLDHQLGADRIHYAWTRPANYKYGPVRTDGPPWSAD